LKRTFADPKRGICVMDESSRGKWTKAGQRTRRNVIAAASIFTSALFAGAVGRPKSAGAAPVCFLKGTRIWTPDGETKVEDLRINDRVVTFSGEAKPIKWIGRLRVRWTKENAPILVAQSVLGPNNPHRDLYLSGGHSLYLDGVLIPVVDLVNDQTIVRCQADRAEIEYFHIKLERHDIIFAEGAACETLVGQGVVCCDNFEEYRALYGDPPAEPFCAPLLGYNGGRSAIKGRLRSAISPLVDVRTKLDIVRDNLEERAAAL
jgi:Hint domain